MGGNKKGSFTEAWVEFDKKKIAKRVAESLNNKPIGGKKSDFFASDLWNIRYLHKFKWSDLTEKIGTCTRAFDVAAVVGSVFFFLTITHTSTLRVSSRSVRGPDQNAAAPT